MKANLKARLYAIKAIFIKLIFFILGTIYDGEALMRRQVFILTN